MEKFIQAIGAPHYKLLKAEAKSRGVTVQELVRNIVDGWVKNRESQIAERIEKQAEKA